MKRFFYCVVMALSGLAFSGCKDSVVEHRAKVEAQWKIQVHGFLQGDRAAFESVLSASSKAQPEKADQTFAAVNGLAVILRTTEADVRVENVSFNKEFTQAIVTAAHKATNEPGGWKAFPNPETWVREKGRWLRQL